MNNTTLIRQLRHIDVVTLKSYIQFVCSVQTVPYLADIQPPVIRLMASPYFPPPGDPLAPFLVGSTSSPICLSPESTQSTQSFCVGLTFLSLGWLSFFSAYEAADPLECRNAFASLDHDNQEEERDANCDHDDGKAPVGRLNGKSRDTKDGLYTMVSHCQ